MTRGRGTASIVASPVLVGAVTTLIVLVSVYLSYNANTGLPFVPTYNLRAQLPGGANLVPGNEVRLGGFRIGVIDKIEPGTALVQGHPRSVAVLLMKLDKSAQPLPSDTTVLVRPRSALGLKYVQLTPGKSRSDLRDAATIEKSPPTEATAIESFRIQRPFIADFTDLSARLRPAAAILPSALPPLNAALRIGTPVLRRSVILNQNTTKVFNALDDLANDPNTLLALKDLSQLTRSGAPLFQYISPFQTVCNYATYFFNALGSHISEGTISGTAERVLLKGGNDWQEDVAYNSFGARPSDLPPNVGPIGASVGRSDGPAYVLHNQAYPPAIDAQGNANCAKGQFGYPAGPLLDNPGRYRPVNGSLDTTPGPD